MKDSDLAMVATFDLAIPPSVDHAQIDAFWDSLAPLVIDHADTFGISVELAGLQPADAGSCKEEWRAFRTSGPPG